MILSICSKKMDQRHKNTKGCPLNLEIQDPGPAISTASTDTLLYSVYDRYSRSLMTVDVKAMPIMLTMDGVG